jgi:hypothetical protein
MKSSVQTSAAKPGITADEAPVGIQRKLPRDSWRDGLQSVSFSLILHVLLFLIPISWLITQPLATSDDLLVLAGLDSKLNLQEPMENAPIEQLAQPPVMLPRQEHDSPALMKEEPELSGITLASLQMADPAAKQPAPQPQETPTEKPPAETETANPALEKEVQDRLDREGAKSGAVQISLIWNNGNDLDVYAQTPLGDIIAFNYKQSRCGGELDVDMNAKKPESTKPVENVFWSEQKAPLGVFVVGVHEYQNHGFRDPTAYLVSVKVAGETHHFRGNIRAGQTVKPICKFQRTKDGVKFLETPETFGGNRTGKPVFK